MARWSREVLRELTGFDDPLELFDALDTDEKGEIGHVRMIEQTWCVWSGQSILHVDLFFRCRITVLEGSVLRAVGGIEEFCDGLWEVAVSDSPLEIKRMQCLGSPGSQRDI